MEDKDVEVKRAVLRPCMTCPLCHKLFRNATSIIECIHTFCRKCIYTKLSEEDMDCCPVCNISLGCVPLEKLRPDHNLQDLRQKLFPKRRAVRIVLPAKRKERSLSSLVTSTPRVYTHIGTTTRKQRKTSKGCAFTIVNQLENNPDAMKKESDGVVLYKRRDYGVDVWKPLTCVVEDVNRSKCLTEGSCAKSKPDDITESKAKKQKNEIREEGKIPQSPLVLGDAASSCTRKQPIWFSLVATSELKGDLLPLPQISASFLRIKDGSMLVSLIENYLKKKLNLSNEVEVEIKCMGQTIISTLRLDQLVQLWLQATANDCTPVTVGQSAKDFVMVLNYARRSPQ